jgi:phosphoenolpyruvate phosphomutase
LAATGQGPTVTAIGAVNAIAARVAVDAGFDALWLSSLEASAALGLPDENLLSTQDLLCVVHALRRSADLPIIVDIDNAGGTIAFSRRIALELGSSGAAGFCLEDSAYPRVNSFATYRTQSLADAKLTGAQLQVIRETAGPELVLIARTETLVCGGASAEALERAESYAAAGADAVLVHSKEPGGRQSLEVAAQWSGTVPLVVVTTAFPHLSLEELNVAGFALAIYANQLSRAALAAMRDVARTFAGTGRFLDPGLASVEDLIELARPEMAE